MTDLEWRLLINALKIGSDKTTAAEFAGITLQQLDDHLALYPDLTRELAQAEATAELNHIRTLRAAADEPKNWRASAFWLKQHNPDRYARPANQLTKQQLEECAEMLLAELATVFPDERLPAVHQKLLAILSRLEPPAATNGPTTKLL